MLVLAARQAGKELCIELEEVVRLDPENIDARMELGAAYLNVGRGADAAQVYEEVLRRRPRHAPALKLAADLARERGELERASGYYAKLRWLAPTDPRPVFLMASAHAEAGNLELAERLFAEAARFPGMRADALSNLGALALKRGEPKQALWYLERAAKGAPGKPGVRYNHALALHRVGRDGDALNELRAAEAADPTDAGVRFLAGVVSLRLGLLDLAVASFREAVRIDPGHQDARHNLALLAPLAGAGGVALPAQRRPAAAAHAAAGSARARTAPAALTVTCHSEPPATTLRTGRRDGRCRRSRSSACPIWATHTERGGRPGCAPRPSCPARPAPPAARRA